MKYNEDNFKVTKKHILLVEIKFNQRLKLKEYPYKIIMNSLYGKFGQRFGHLLELYQLEEK